MEISKVDRKQIEKLAIVLKNSRIKIFEYLVDEDTLVVYDEKFHIEKTIAGYMDYIDDKSKIYPEDREKVKQLYKEAKEATIEIREFGEDGDIKYSVLEFMKIVNEDGKLTLIGSTRDITEQRKQEKKLKERARKDSLTGLYNQVYGKKYINKYLNRKKPFDSCGMIVLDVDCFKSVNDNYGHLFGDKVLARLAMLLKEVFRDNDSILMRAGGDEFVIFVKDILNIELVRKNVELMQKIRELQFGKTGCTITCSAGCCYLPENVSGYTYDQLFENADIALYKAKERGKNFANKTSDYMMIYMDFENFKYFNYKYGYTLGDQVLKDFCSFIIGKTEEKHNLYFTRVVSDQFLMFRTASHEKDEYQAIIEETEKINEEFMLRQKEKFPKSNVVLRTGIYYVTPECRSTSYAIDAANYVRQKVKGGEKGSVRFYDDEMQKQHEFENEIVNDMKEAMEQKQFKVYFQPQYSIKSHEIIGAEALVRWERDNGTVLSPNAFIPVYENNGKIIELDFYVFETVVEFIAENLKAGREQVPISINASSLHASDPQTINTYINILKKYSVDPTMVEIELTETAVVSEYESVRKLFDSFQLHGIKTAMDDFGSGYSVLNTIVDIPVDVIKIDRGFITSCLETDRGIYFLKHLIDMIRNLGYQIICEGVETDEQIEILRQIGCDEIQGYWYSKPLKMEDYKELLQSEKISKGGAKHPNRQKVLRYTLGNENLKERKIQ